VFISIVPMTIVLQILQMDVEDHSVLSMKTNGELDVMSLLALGGVSPRKTHF